MSDRLLHYVRHTDIAFSEITGIEVATLCGDYTRAVTPGSPKAAATFDSPVCPACARRMKLLRAKHAEAVAA